MNPQRRTPRMVSTTQPRNVLTVMRRGSLPVLCVLLAAVTLAGCRTLEQLPILFFDHETARERYEARLELVGVTGTALGRDWLAAASQALDQAPLVGVPHIEQGFLPAAEPAAVAFRVRARRGQEIAFEFSLPGDSSTLVFIDAWEVGRDSAGTLHHLEAADSGARALLFEPRRDGEYVFRAQPELLRGGRFSATLRVGPTLAFPVDNGREDDVGSTWGDPRDGGVRNHHGIDIFAARGTPVLAASEAYVRRVETTRRGGNVVWLRDARGNSLYYAHLDRQAVAEGARVEPGDTIGFVGNSGNARTTPPHLHFGVYRRGEGPVDPWWFVHRPRDDAPVLAVDTALFGGWVRTPRGGAALLAAPGARAARRAELARHTPLRVLSGVGEWYRVRLPDGGTGFLAARAVEAIAGALERAALAGSLPLLTQPRAPVDPGTVLALVPAGASVEVLGRYGDYLYVRIPGGVAGWVTRLPDGPAAAGGVSSGQQ